MDAQGRQRAIRLRPWPDRPEKKRAERLASWFGWFGAHWFYLKRPWIGAVYLVFAWTFVPLVLGVVDHVRLAAMSPTDFERRYAPPSPPDLPRFDPPADR